MKPPSWDNFIKQIAEDYELRGMPKQVFLTRFAYENWRKPDTEVWELAEAASHETYKKQMSEVYSAFAQDKPDGCPELDPKSRGPGKFQVLREWLKDLKYPEWLQTLTPSAPPTLPLPDAPTLVRWNSALYIQYPAIEAECYQEILTPGCLIRIKAPEKRGKTSLLTRILAYAEGHGCRKVYLNLRQAEGAIFASLDKFLRWFCANVSRELGLKPLLDDYWDEELFGSMVSCKTYFQGHILEPMVNPLALGLDNLDRVFEYPEIARDFLPMLRYWHEEANNLEVWQKLRLVIANSTEAYVDLAVNQSPFNVGRPVKLPGLDLEQLQQLAKGYGLAWAATAEGAKLLAPLQGMLGGHPYLIHLALDFLLHQPEIKWEKLLAEAPTQGGIYGSHLRHHWDTLQKQPALAGAMKEVVTSDTSVQLEPTLAYKLESMGLVALVGDEAKPSCELYRQYFRDNL